jgi:prepilin-type processing-associated H-X9-DG protein/prepilin-type N-terminal cleavage/methylation domain-containing protein
MKPRVPRIAFSLIELIVVIAIIAILMALLLGAVQRVRETASRTTCLNRMKQQALGLHTYHTAHSSLPSGHHYAKGKSPLLYAGWQVPLLPYIEQQEVYRIALDDFSRRQDPLDKPAHRGLSTVIATYTCPSDRRIQNAVLSKTDDLLVAFTSYMGVCGTNCFKPDGVLYSDSAISFRSIQDGLSQTLLLGERPPSDNFRLGWWYAGLGQGLNGSADMVLGAREESKDSDSDCPTGVYQFQSSRTSNPCSAFHFWSLHPGGANFAFCDGSVRFLSYNADGIMPALATRAGGETATLTD